MTDSTSAAPAAGAVTDAERLRGVQGEMQARQEELAAAERPGYQPPPELIAESENGAPADIDSVDGPVLMPGDLDGGRLPYTDLVDPRRARVLENTHAIHALHKKSVENVLEIGDRLLEIKKDLGERREFLQHIKQNFEFSISSAYNYMIVAKKRAAGEFPTVGTIRQYELQMVNLRDLYSNKRSTKRGKAAGAAKNEKKSGKDDDKDDDDKDDDNKDLWRKNVIEIANRLLVDAERYRDPDDVMFSARRTRDELAALLEDYDAGREPDDKPF
jgi:hypothetical protein